MAVVRRRNVLAAVAVLVVALAIGLGSWALASSGGSPCKPGYDYRYQYTTIVGRVPISHYACVRTR